ncbi:MAG TPA: hypothetical protein VHS09_08475, partial [Polyangiaceae bacterium]|nr:hypothetical protein [Polyangiaceae bacterium]
MTRATLLAGLGAITGCSSVLGLDAPTLDPCTRSGACLDATADAVAETSTSLEGAAEAGPEAAPACVWDGAVPDAG